MRASYTNILAAAKGWTLKAQAVGILTLALLAGACGGQSGTSEDSQLKIGLLPIPETLPMWVADRDGYFAAENVSVVLVNFASAVERDAALSAGQLDGEVNDLVSVGLLDRDRSAVKVVRLAFQGTPGQPMISLVVGPGSKARGAGDLRGAEVALSQNTVIEYVVDSLLQRQGLSSSELKKTEVPKIPLRLEMLNKGQVAAAGLPEPFATLARKQGARVVVDDGETTLGQSTISFRTEVLAKKGAVVRRFLRAYERAVNEINANPERYRAVLVDKAKVPEDVRDIYAVPLLPRSSVPREADVKAAFDWMSAKNLLSRKLGSADVVDASYLPK